MTRHYLGLQDASVLATRDLLLTGRAIADLIESEAMGAVVGPAGLGKTFAIEHALAGREEQVITLTFEARPTMRLVADRLLVALTGAPGRGTRFAMTDHLLNRLSDRRRLVVIGEAQNLNRDCFEYLRHLHDDPATRFALLFDGGDGCWEVLAREPMLRSRIYRRVAFRALSDADVLALIPGYHPIYAGADPELLVLINDKAVWAASLVGGVHADRQPDLPRARCRATRQGDHPQRDLPARHRAVRVAMSSSRSTITSTVAGYQLAKLITGLPDELLALIGYDQITDDAILGCPVPVAARPILRAIEGRHEPVLDIPWPDPDAPRENIADQDHTTEVPLAVDREYAMALGRLLCGRSGRIPRRDLSRPVRSRFEALEADGILDRRYRVYRASHIALYSTFRVTDPADQGTDKRPGRSTDKTRESG